MAAIFEHSEAIVLDPKPGFVVKTKIIEGQGDHLYSTKVFINICHEERVPKPGVDFDPQIVFPLIVKNEWEIPIIVSLEKKDTDKKGVPSFVYDCCINSLCYQWVQVSKDLRMILVEWALESVEMMHELVLERETAFPKMASKGELSRTEITAEDLKNGLQKRLLELKQNETAGLIQELHGGSLEAEDENLGSTLPDLTNIAGNRQKPLIEVIEEMSLEEKDADVSSDGVKEKTSIMREAEISFDEKSDRNLHDESVLKYTFSVTQKQHGSDHYVLFESPQLTKNIIVSFYKQEPEAQSIITLTNVDINRRLGENNQLEVGVPLPYVPYRSFFVEKKGQLYVFCRERE